MTGSRQTKPRQTYAVGRPSRSGRSASRANPGWSGSPDHDHRAGRRRRYAARASSARSRRRPDPTIATCTGGRASAADRVGQQPAGEPGRLSHQSAGAAAARSARSAYPSRRSARPAARSACTVGAQPGRGRVVGRILRPGVERSRRRRRCRRSRSPVGELVSDHRDQLLRRAPARPGPRSRPPAGRRPGPAPRSPPAIPGASRPPRRGTSGAAGRPPSAAARPARRPRPPTASQSGRSKTIAACTRESTSQPFQAATTLSSRRRSGSLARGPPAAVPNGREPAARVVGSPSSCSVDAPCSKVPVPGHREHLRRPGAVLVPRAPRPAAPGVQA